MLIACPIARGGDEPPLSHVMEFDPEFEIPRAERTIDENLLPLWREVLARPEAEYQRLAARSIADAHVAGFEGMEEARPELLHVLTAANTHRAARFAAAHALIALQSTQFADDLFQASQEHGDALRYLIEPALAEWDYERIRPVWRSRLGNPQTRRRELLLAAAGAGKVGDAEALPGLIALVRDGERSPDVRLAAAQGAGEIAESGLEPEADALLADGSGSVLDRLCAVSLLLRHSSEAAQRRLTVLARDREPSIAAAALGALFAIDPELVVPLAEEALQNPDANVRFRGVDAYVALPTPERLSVLGPVLDDPHPGVRTRVREALREHAQRPEFSDVVREAAMEQLNRESWRGQEQAAILLASLDHEPAAERMIQLLPSDRPEVMIASAWGLRVLAIPETAPALLEEADRKTAARLQGAAHPLAIDEQVAHLFEALGQLHHTPAIALMRQYIPKSVAHGELSRGAAVWSLGLLFEAKPDEGLAAELMARLLDVASMPPELFIVRRMSAITIGRMQATSQLATLRGLVGPTVEPGDIEHAIAWAIREMTGQELPLSSPGVIPVRGWFLEPLPEAAQ